VPRPALSLLDSTCLIVGIIVGAGIYQVAPAVARGASSDWVFLCLWLVGGVLSLCGALGYAELASAYPQEGGDYAYLTRAYGRWAGFLFGWIQLVVVRPGDIAVMAFAFATYARAIHDPLAGAAGAHSQQVYACLAVAGLTAVNLIGVKLGKTTQNLLTMVKVLGLLGIVCAAALASPAPAVVTPVEPLPLSLAMILILFTFGGWNEMAYVAAEVKNPGRNIVRALVLGTVAVTLLYLLVNGAFLRVLGFAGVAQAKAVATATVSAVLPETGGYWISLLVCLSALGAVNGLIFTGARISYAMGCDHRVFQPLGVWKAQAGTPARALLVQGVIALVLILFLGSFLDTLLYTAAPVYLFYLATTAAVLVLRRKDGATPRPFRAWGYPVTPVVFGLVCVFLAYSAIIYKPWVALAALGVLLAGWPVYWWSERSARRFRETQGSAGAPRGPLPGRQE
jgi:basic amino acid/polyamine antiporter, APA family